MTARDRLRMWMCGRTRPRAGKDDVGDLIDEAERTRRELTRITDRLTAHVIELKALTRAYTRQHEGTDPPWKS